ncbi:MAG TPA: NAD(P)-binding domain-containing protein [Candidatus Dormibacteraeota bacterium]|nr:NAD(P)-binding domain-containing protein [Candidatus Dormibacteraeota bacterium]
MAYGAETPWMLGARADTHDADARAAIVAAIKAAGANGWLLLETCHRVELYGFGQAPDIDPSLQLTDGEAAVHHVMRVAAGLDSAIVGEDEVLHQVRTALTTAASTGRLDRRLHRLFEMAIAAGRQARRKRSSSSANLAQRAIKWLAERSPVTGHRVLIAGAGHMGSALAHKATLLGASVTVASRSPARARRLAHVYGGDSADLFEAAKIAPHCAAIAVALGGPWNELQPFEYGCPPIADISAPPAVSAAVRERAVAGYLGIDDLFARDEPAPRAYVENADRVVKSKAADYMSWLQDRA